MRFGVGISQRRMVCGGPRFKSNEVGQNICSVY